MPDSTEQLTTSLGRYQAYVVGGLAFIVLFAISMMGVMLYLAFAQGHQAAKLEAVARETHGSICALYQQNVVANREARSVLEESPRGLLNTHGDVIIDATLIQRGIDQRQDTIDALRGAGLTC